MLKRLILLVGLSLSMGFLAGCDVVEETQDTARQGAMDTIKQVDRSRVLSDLTLVTGALNTYHAQNEKYPETLDELNLKLYHPEDLEYDPKTGQVHSKTFPKL